ncbi:phosphatidic acid phosphatase type 2/haloperoxidase [Lipomyces tetrasporus]|uniref:Phosphatidic acid phosphatase type 2/haloperoxidase n=1 Tax=Lipomyces tetrasporus TaxID=54092 RepID=A0AAD7QSY4_9ASCO|nr:phosphatidic acid phosphatase type 2/haloperoxidase [Lipomyces tetrasporus]KAJ8100756.1 phosphatidic acid phosphatase type 2/haloperoxidase [Lipomyces tetrasporus]
MARRRASHVRILLSCVFDYLVLIVLIAIWAYISSLPPNLSRFSLTDISLQYPVAVPETISYPLACVLCIAVPAAIIVVWALAIDFFRYRSPLRTRLWELNCGILGLALSITMTVVITTSLKAIVGRPRPDSIARCLPAEGSMDAAPYGLSTIDICTQTDRDVLEEGWRSWPSGHSSTAFAGLFYLSLYFAGKLSLCDNKGEVWKTAVVMFPSLGAGAIATSRILDHRHHGTDVLFGSLFGAAIAWMSYRQYFPSLADTARQGRAWNMRAWGETKVSPDAANGDIDEAMSRDDESRVDVEIGEFRRRQTGGQPQPPYGDRGPAGYSPGEYELGDYRVHEWGANLSSKYSGARVLGPSNSGAHLPLHDDDDNDHVDKASASENPFERV